MRPYPRVEGAAHPAKTEDFFGFLVEQIFHAPIDLPRLIDAVIRSEIAYYLQ
jgi:hypothetical protein